MNDSINTPSDAERRALIKARGIEALVRIKTNQTYDDWRTVGTVLLVITEETLASFNLPADGWDKDNKKVVKEFNRRWEAWEQSAGDRVGNNQAPLTAKRKQERWALRELMTNPVYHDWYMTLVGPERRGLNYPNAIITKYKTKHSLKPKKKPGTATKDLEKKLEQKDAYIAEILASNDAGNQITSESTPKEIADTLARMRPRPQILRDISARLLVWAKELEARTRKAKKSNEARQPQEDSA